MVVRSLTTQVVVFLSAILFARDIRPSIDNDRDLGSSSFRWDDIYATNNVIQTSDKRLKKGYRHH